MTKRWPADDPSRWMVHGDVDHTLLWIEECRRVLDGCERRLRDALAGQEAS